MWSIKVHGLLDQPKPKRLGIKVNVLLRIASDSSHVVNAVWINAQVSPEICYLVCSTNLPETLFPLPRLESMEIDYEQFDGEWRKISLTGPARRTLVDAKLYKVSDLRRISLAELIALPGMSKSAVARIRQIMDAKKIKFRPQR